jgi:hypothetical protein
VGADGDQGNLTLLVAVALLLGVAASVAGEVVTIRFAPESAPFAEAAREYQGLWAAEGDRIIEALQDVTGLKFLEREIRVVVYEGVSRSGFRGTPMRLRASYPSRDEEGDARSRAGPPAHRAAALAAAGSRRASSPVPRPVRRLGEALRAGVCPEQVEIEKRRKGAYDYEAAWVWALARTKEERVQRFREIVDKNQPALR